MSDRLCDVRFLHGFNRQRDGSAHWLRDVRLSCRRFAANAVRLHALAYNLATFLRTPALLVEVRQWSLTTLRDRLVKIGAKIVRHGRSITVQLAEVMISRGVFQHIL